jgi:hypothetical protein
MWIKSGKQAQPDGSLSRANKIEVNPDEVVFTMHKHGIAGTRSMLIH